MVVRVGEVLPVTTGGRRLAHSPDTSGARAMNLFFCSGGAEVTNAKSGVVAMPYSEEINRETPTYFVLLVDQSKSMQDPFGGALEQTKADGVASAVNRVLHELVKRCAKGETIRDYFYIGVIGYGKTVGSGLGGELAGQGLVPVSEIGTKPLRIEERSKKESDGAGGVFVTKVKFPIWFEAVAKNGTPMCEALRQAREAVTAFISRFPKSFPPIVINITDGEATDGDPEPEAAALREVCSEDGNVLLFNVHISDKNEQPILYPDNMERLPDEHAQRLFRMSSEVPPVMRNLAETNDIRLREGTRGFVFNGDLVSVVQLLDIGTRLGENMR